ncbi:MFS transporter [Candidatus Saccharibacteria bacterium]|nr:MFS transporter [Candidatus Saccharibacteria bacterium]
MKLPLSYRALQAEVIITQTVISMAIISIFFIDIGLSQAQVGISQAIFTAMLLVFNIPFGKLADRYSRRALNAIGDFLAASGFLWYFFATSFTEVIIIEMLIGLGLAASLGVDIALMRGYCHKYNLNYKNESAKIFMIAPIIGVIGMAGAGFLASINIRLPFLVDASLFAIGALLTIFFKDFNEKLNSVSLKDLLHTSLFKNKKLSSRILSLAVIRESTHAIVWLFAPLIVIANGPVWLAGIAWALMRGSASFGALATKYMARHNPANNILLPIVSLFVGSVLCITGLLPLIMLGVTIIGATVGYTKTISGPMLAEVSDAKAQTTIASLSSTIGQLMYIPAVIAINWLAGEFGYNIGLIANVAVFGVLGIYMVTVLRKYP